MPTMTEIVAEWRRQAMDVGDFAMVAVCDAARNLPPTGRAAVEAARSGVVGGTLRKWGDVDGAREVSIEEADAILREDPSLLYLDGTDRERALSVVRSAEAAVRRCLGLTARLNEEVETERRHQTPAESYWDTVLGSHRSPAAVVREFGRSTGRDLDEWLGACEVEARSAGLDLTDEEIDEGRPVAAAEIEAAVEESAAAAAARYVAEWDEDEDAPESYAEAAEAFAEVFGRRPDRNDGDRLALVGHIYAACR